MQSPTTATHPQSGEEHYYFTYATTTSATLRSKHVNSFLCTPIPSPDERFPSCHEYSSNNTGRQQMIYAVSQNRETVTTI
eukprot:scaffold535_cov65-Cylindrotheca_fusiformis.AAC.7